jgi:uncharacterized protein (TIGR02147 family)
LSDQESRYLETLALRERAKSRSDIESYDQTLARLRKAKAPRSLSIDQFRLIADWHHLAILEMMSLKDFKADPEWISRRLGGKISTSSVLLALQRLERMGLVQKARGALAKRADPSPLLIDPGSRNLAVQAHHEQMLLKAAASLKEQETSEREFRSSTLSIKKENYAKAQARIREFHQSMLELAEDSSADETYQLNVQFFKLSHRIENQEGRKK